MEPFLLARNPDPDSNLPYLVRLPIEGGIVLKTRESLPRANRSYCHPAGEWPADAEILEEVAVAQCLDEARLSTSSSIVAPTIGANSSSPGAGGGR